MKEHQLENPRTSQRDRWVAEQQVCVGTRLHLGEDSGEYWKVPVHDVEAEGYVGPTYVYCK